MKTIADRTCRANPVEVNPCQYDLALPDADWADAYEVGEVTYDADIRSLARRTVGSMPPSAFATWQGFRATR